MQNITLSNSPGKSLNQIDQHTITKAAVQVAARTL